jgi:hypothetical protein
MALLLPVRLKSMLQCSLCVYFTIIRSQLSPAAYFVSSWHLMTCFSLWQHCWEVLPHLMVMCVSKTKCLRTCYITFCTCFFNNSLEGLCVKCVSRKAGEMGRGQFLCCSLCAFFLVFWHYFGKRITLIFVEFIPMCFCLLARNMWCFSRLSRNFPFLAFLLLPWYFL